MKIVITGGSGMLGRTLARHFADHDVVALDRHQLDVTSEQIVGRVFEQHRPEIVLHCAAMTAVDACEVQSDEAMQVNAAGSANVATAAAAVGARIVSISTDYVFAGNDDRPYHESDVPAPRTRYGQSKLAGEQAVQALCRDHLIVRTAWLYGPGGPSFVHTMLRLAARDQVVRVVDDQRGSPTSTDALAVRIRELVDSWSAGTVHVTCSGDATWYELAREVFSHCAAVAPLVPCTGSEYVRLAPRPADSRLENRATRSRGFAPMPDWRDALKQFFLGNPGG